MIRTFDAIVSSERARLKQTHKIELKAMFKAYKPQWRVPDCTACQLCKTGYSHLGLTADMVRNLLSTLSAPLGPTQHIDLDLQSRTAVGEPL